MDVIQNKNVFSNYYLEIANTEHRVVYRSPLLRNVQGLSGFNKQGLLYMFNCMFTKFLYNHNIN